jgi:glycosyl transferase family 25
MILETKIYVVNLRRSIERRLDIKQKLESKHVNFEFFEAVDGKLEGHGLFKRYDRRRALRNHGFELTLGELGCYASHFLLWEKSIQENINILILEDDIKLCCNFVAAMQFAEQEIERFGLIRFSAHKHRKIAICKKSETGLRIVRFKRGPHGTSAYMISPVAAKKLVNNAKVWFEPVDVHLDRFWKHGVGSFGVQPYPVHHMELSAVESEIWQGERRGSRSAKFRRETRLVRMKDSFLRSLANIAYTGRWIE